MGLHEVATLYPFRSGGVRRASGMLVGSESLFVHEEADAVTFHDLDGGALGLARCTPSSRRPCPEAYSRFHGLGDDVKPLAPSFITHGIVEPLGVGWWTGVGGGPLSSDHGGGWLSWSLHRFCMHHARAVFQSPRRGRWAGAWRDVRGRDAQRRSRDASGVTGAVVAGAEGVRGVGSCDGGHAKR